jgi:hypothetical protein
MQGAINDKVIRTEREISLMNRLIQEFLPVCAGVGGITVGKKSDSCGRSRC